MCRMSLGDWASIGRTMPKPLRLRSHHFPIRPTRAGAEGSTCQLLCHAFLGGTMEESKKVVPLGKF